MAVALGALGAGLGGGRSARAATLPAVPVSLGTVTVAIGAVTTTYTFAGSIAVGNGVFTGTATGTAAGPELTNPPGARNPVPSFALSGPGLTGTCSGQWLIDPTTSNSPLAPRLGLSGTPVNIVSLSCALQLGLAPPAETSLTLLLVSDVPPLTHFTGAYGPGVSAVPVPLPPSRGVVDKAEWSASGSAVAYHLLGDISLGGQIFHGDASGGYNSSNGGPGLPFPVTGSSPSGNLTAACTDSLPLVLLPSPLSLLATALTCTGQVGTGPVGTTSLLLVTPIFSQRTIDPCGHCSSTDWTGVFVGT